MTLFEQTVINDVPLEPRIILGFRRDPAQSRSVSRCFIPRDTMAVTLGKRKRCDKALASEDQDSSSSGDENVRALFQKAFEAKFRPLKVRKPSKTNNPPVEEVDNAEEQEESEWSGLSGSERDVEIIEHDAPQNTDRDQLRRETKAFMVRAVIRRVCARLAEA